MVWYVSKTPMENGSYPNPISNKFVDSFELTQEQVDFYCQYNGFVFIKETEDGVELTPNLEAWESWKEYMESLPKPEVPKTDEEKVYENLADAIRDGVNATL